MDPVALPSASHIMEPSWHVYDGCRVRLIKQCSSAAAEQTPRSGSHYAGREARRQVSAKSVFRSSGDSISPSRAFDGEGNQELSETVRRVETMVRDWTEIPYDRYLNDALTLSATEKVRLEGALDRLPYRIVDSHTHIARPRDVGILPPTTLAHVVSTYPSYTLEDAKRVRECLWPHKRVRALRMALPVEGFCHRDINDYLIAEASAYDDLVVGYGIPDDFDYTRSLIESGNICALKMYHRYREPGAERILDVFPSAALQVAQACGVPIILHLPKSLPQGLADLATGVLDRFPQLTVVLAHLGGPGGQRFNPSVTAAYKRLAEYPNVFMDTALVFDSELIASSLQYMGTDRVLFGTDEPLSLIRAINYIHATHGHRLYAPGYHWAQNDSPSMEVTQASRVLLHIQQVESVLAALESFPPAARDAVFFRNAASVFGLESSK